MSDTSAVDELHTQLKDEADTVLDTKDDNERWEALKRLVVVRDQLLEQEITKARPQGAPSGDKKTVFLGFNDWLKDNGAVVSGVKFVADLPEGNGVLATRDVEAGAPVFTIPVKVMITQMSVLKSPLQPVIARSDMLNEFPDLQLALLLMYEYTRGPMSPWQPYINILPRKYSLPLYFDVGDFEALRGTRVERQVVREFARVLRVYSILAETVGKIGPIFEKGEFTLYNFRWTLSCVFSRQNLLPIGNKGILALIPAFDMVNHAPGQYTAGFDPATKSMTLHALKKYSKDEQVFMYYGPRANSLLFLRQGFTLPSNPNDQLPLTVTFAESDPLREEKLSVLKQLGLEGDTVKVRILANDVDPVTSVTLRVMACNDKALLTDPETIEKLKRGEALSIECDLAMLTLLRELCEKTIESYPTTLKEDLENIAAGGHSETRLAVLNMLVSEKRLLQTNAALASSTRKQLRGRERKRKKKEGKKAEKEASK